MQQVNVCCLAMLASIDSGKMIALQTRMQLICLEQHICKMGEPCVGLAFIAIAAQAETGFDTPVAHVAAICCQQEQD